MLFGLAIDFVMRAAVDKNNSGLTLIPRRSSRYPEVKLADLDYADDIALFEESETKMAETTEAIRVAAGKLGLQMSFKKTEILPIQCQSSKQLQLFHLEMKASSKWSIILNTRVLVAAQMAPMLKKSTIG